MMAQSVKLYALSTLDYAVVVLAGLALLPFAMLLLLRSRRPRMSVYVSLGKLLRLHVTVSVDRPDKAGRKGGNV